MNCYLPFISFLKNLNLTKLKQNNNPKLASPETTTKIQNKIQASKFDFTYLLIFFINATTFWAHSL